MIEFLDILDLAPPFGLTLGSETPVTPGLVALTEADIAAIAAAVAASISSIELSIMAVVELPVSGSRDYTFDVITKDSAGALADADMDPQIKLKDPADGNLDTAWSLAGPTKPAAGVYRYVISIPSTYIHKIFILQTNVIQNGVQRSRWAEVTVLNVWRGEAERTITGGALNPTGVYAITIAFENGGGDAVPNVSFIVVGQGSGVADGSGNASVNLNAGTYTVRAASGNGVLFADASITVSGAGQTFTIAATGLGISPPPSLSQTMGYIVTRDGQGNPEADVVISFRLVTPPNQTESFPLRSFSATSDGSGLLQVALAQSASYAASRDGGTEVPFTTATTSTYPLPQVLSKRGS